MPPKRFGVLRRELAMFGAHRLFTEEAHPLGIEVVQTGWACRISPTITPDPDHDDRYDNGCDSHPDDETVHTEPPLDTI